jgi:hypothetical protein
MKISIPVLITVEMAGRGREEGGIWFIASLVLKLVACVGA